MKTKIPFHIPYFLLPITVLLLACESPIHHDLVVTHVSIIDVKTGAIIPNQSVAIDGDSITAVYKKEIDFSDRTKVIDGAGKYLIPGLWDMHVHHNWNYKDTNPLLIANGITGIREMWGDMYVHDKIQKGINEGTMNVPDVYTGSIIIDGKPRVWPGSIEVETAEEAKKAALEQIENGVDFLKVYSNLSKEAFDAVAAVANEKGVPFAGHIPEKVTIQYAAKKGMVSAEHFYGMLYGSSSKQDSLFAAGAKESQTIQMLLNTFSQEKFDSLCQVLVDEQLWLSPTMVTNRGYSNQFDPEFIDDKRLAYMPDYLVANWIPDSSVPLNPKDLEWINTIKKEYGFWSSRIGEMHQKGVRFLAGSDYPNPFCFPGFSLHDEIELYVAGGMDQLSALQTATLNPAIFMGKEDEYGSIAVGKKASLVLLDENPLDVIGNTRSIRAVILRGKLFDKPVLEQMLESTINKKKMKTYSSWMASRIAQNGIEMALDSLDLLLASKDSLYRLDQMELNMLGYQLMQQGQLSEAIKIFKKNTELFPDEYNVYDSYAEALFSDGQFEKAKENYAEAIKINPYYKSGQVMIDSINNISAKKIH